MKKNNIKYFAAIAASMLAFACTPDFPSPDKNGLPLASSLTPVITVDQETNYVTFSIKETGVVPMWIFGEDKVDGKANKTYAYTGNGISLRIREAGEHTVEVKAYNANGISQGSKMATYVLENTYRDPFDPTPYMKKMNNTWMWNAEIKGHFGCGPSGTDGLEWWSCDPHGKDGYGLYDDTMTFTTDGSYTFNPGEGGTVYVNWESGYKPEGHAEEIAAETDYQAPIEAYTHSYTVENNWNAAGIEEIYVVLETGDNLSYIPNADALKTPRYRLNTENFSSKSLDLIYDNGGIAWRYQLVPYVKTVGPEELLAGTEATGKAWIMDPEAKGHLACGPSEADPTSWWAAGPYEKDGFGMYDDTLIFYPDGTYEFMPGEASTIYVNKDVTVIGASVNPHDGQDFQLAWEPQVAKYSFDGEVITLPEGTVIGYVPNDKTFNDPTFVVTDITETSLTLVANAEGISWQYKFKARDIKAPEATIGGQPVVGGKVELSLKNGETVAVTGINLDEYWIDPDFFEPINGSSVKFVAKSGDYQIMNVTDPKWLKVVPVVDGEVATWAKGKALWIIGEGAGKPQGAAPGWSTGVAADLPLAMVSDNTYQATLYCTTKTNIKLFGQPDWGKEFLVEDYASINGNGFIYTYKERGEGDNGNLFAMPGFVEGWYVFEVTADGDMLSLTVTQKKDVVYDIDGDTNLWKTAVINPVLYYTGADWSGSLTGSVTPDTSNGGYKVTVPAGIGGERWKGQNKLRTGIATSSEKAYDFCATFLADEDCVITIKITGWDPEHVNDDGTKGNDDDKHVFTYVESFNLSADTPVTFKAPKISQPTSCSDFCFITDYGLVPGGTTIAITGICLQEHI